MPTGDESRDHAVVNGHHGDYDALAELFLGDDAQSDDAPTLIHSTAESEPRAETSDPAPAQRSDSAKKATIEALVLGHLPVLAGAWALAYAGEVAERERRVIGMLRLTAGRASVDVFGADHIKEIATSSSVGSLEDAITIAAGCAEHWIVRVDATEEPEIATSHGVDGFTLLCGADEASTVAAYRTLKSLASMLDEAIDTAEPHPTSLRAAVMGAEEAKAEAAATKLRRAAEAFLDRPLQIGPPVQRIGGSRPAHLHDSTTDRSAMDLFRLLREASESMGSADTASTRRVEKSEATVGVTAEVDDSSPSVAPERTSTIREPHSVLAEDAANPGHLAEHLENLRPLAARCPFEQSVELAADDQGALHLLARSAPGAIQALTIVSEWAMEHAQLIALASGEVRIDAATPPTSHVVTDRPAEMRRLLDSSIRVHLLAPVRLGAENGWFCTALN